MTIKTIYKLVIATFGDWMKNHSPYVQREAKPKLIIAPCMCDQFQQFEQVTARHLLGILGIAHFVLVVIGQSNNYFFGIDFLTVI